MNASVIPLCLASLEELCEDAIEQYGEDCTDIHLDAGVPPTYVVNLRHIHAQGPIIKPELIKGAIEKLSTPARIKYQDDQDADGRFTLKDGQIVRLHCYAAESGPALALRIQPKNVRAFSSLGLPSTLMDLLYDEEGFIILSGPTGSGKTTAMHSMLAEYNVHGPEGHIYTIEDPPEYSHRRGNSIIHQREIGVSARSYRSALEGAMRVRPTLILIGEMRRVEEMDATIQMVALGHRALTSVHARDTSRTLLRILQAFEPQQIAEVRETLRNHLIAIVNLRQIPTIDGKLTLACEIMRNIPAIHSNLDSPEKVLMIRDIIASHADEGMQTLEADLVRLENSCVITADTAYKYALVKTDLGGLKDVPTALKA